MYAIATLMHNVTTVWACVVAGLGSQLASVAPAVPRVALVQGGLTEAQAAVVGAYWNVTAYNFPDWSHRKDALWSLTRYERVLYIDGDVLVLPHFDRRQSARVFRAPPGFYAVNFSRPDYVCFNAGIMLLEPSLDVYKQLRAVTRGSSCGGVDQKVLTKVLTRHENIPLKVAMASHFSGGVTSLEKYDMYNTYNSMRSVRDVLYGVSPAHGTLHGVLKSAATLEHVDRLFQERNNLIAAGHPACRLTTDGGAGKKKTKTKKPLEERVFVAVEVEDEALQPCPAGGCRAAGLAAAQCDSLVQGFRTVLFGDSANATLPAACDMATYRPCASANLGSSIASAQKKREFVHLQLLTVAPLYIDWFVSTEQDTWWDSQFLVKYLGDLEASHKDIHEVPAFVGGWQGPFLVMNRRFLERIVSNKTHMDACRAALVATPRLKEDHGKARREKKKNGKRRLGGRRDCRRPDGSLCGFDARYNNDHLVAVCAAGLGVRDVSADCPLKLHVELDALEEKVPGYALFNNGHTGHAPYPAEDTDRALPPNLLAFHRIDANGMRALGRRRRKKGGAKALRACRVYKPGTHSVVMS